MKRTQNRKLLRLAIFASTFALTVGASGALAGAEPAAPSSTTTTTAAPPAAAAPAADAGTSSLSAQKQQLIDKIASGLKDKSKQPVADTGGSSASDTKGSGPEMSAFLAAFGYSLLNPDVAPPGVNDWSCKPSSAHPRPVVLVHGTWADAYDTFAYMSKPIKDAGFCEFAFNYGRSDLINGGGAGSLLPGAYGTGDIPTSAKQLSTFVDRVLSATGAPQVDIIGWSQGGSMTNYYTKYEGGGTKVKNLITYGATHHGTTLDGIGALGRAINNFGIDVLGPISLVVGVSGIQQTVGSDFINKLNANGDTVSGINYTVVGTRYDEITTPYDSTFLTAGPGATVHNITLQDDCGIDLSDHLTMMYSPRALSIALNALDPTKFPNLKCSPNPWLIGGGGHP
ncbi:esterase/lipase family protein [Nocardia sp. NPDC004068]|uniref:esterase/lipase family protein n=1 Tax=Nocardia sp. NPDC004068 TaxID=3364303 RepID=UPI0036772F85